MIRLDCAMIRQPVIQLRLLFSVILAVMLTVTVYASYDYPINLVWSRIGHDAWFHATLADAYCGFITFFAWVAYLETGWFRRLAWLIAILLLGNIAMAGYTLLRLFRLPASASPAEILLRKNA